MTSMLSNRLLRTVTIAFASILCSLPGFSQISGTNVFLQGAYLEAGIGPTGVFGATVSAPSGYHPHSNTTTTTLCSTSVTNALGIVYDYGKDGWSTGTPAAMGDFTITGLPFEGWAIQAGGSVGSTYAASGSCAATGGLTGGITGYSNSGGVFSARWDGSFSCLSIRQIFSIDTLASSIKIKVILTNTCTTRVNDVYYLRTVDPDNSASYTGGSYNTINTIPYQNDYLHRVMVHAKSTGSASAIGNPVTSMSMGTKDCRAKALAYATWPISSTARLDSIYNQTSGVIGTSYYSTTTNVNSDIAIAMVYRLGTIAPNDSVVFTYAYIFDSLAGLENAFPEPKMVINGRTAVDTIDSVTACSGITSASFPVSIANGSTDQWEGSSWSWAPATGLSRATGTSVTIDRSALTATTVYTITGTNAYAASCLTKKLYLRVDPYVRQSPIDGPNTVCIGSVATYTDSLAGGSWSTTGLHSSIDSLGNLTGISNGTDTVYYTLRYSCGNIVIKKAINVVGAVAPITGSDSVCVGATITLVDTSAGGTWRSASTAIATVSTSGAVTGVSAGTVNITYEIASCSTFTTKSIRVLPAPTTGTISGPTSVCAGRSISLSTTGTGGTWSSSNGAVATVLTDGLVSGITSGTVIISYTATNSCGSRSDTQLVTVLPTPAVDSITGLRSVCVGSNITLTQFSSGGGTWSSGNAAVATVNASGVVTGVSSGNTYIQYLISNSCGTAIDTFFITVNPAATVSSISGPSTACTGSTVRYSNATAGGVWTSSNPAVATIDGSGNVTASSLGSTTISYIVTTVCGTASTSQTLTVINSTGSAGPIIGPSSVCIGASVTMTDTPSGGTWSSVFPGIATVDPSTGIVTGVTTGIDTIKYVVTSGCGTATASKVISVNTIPVVSPITGSNAVCAGASVTLSNASSGGTWSSFNTSIATVSTSGVVTGLTPGVDTIYYTVTNSCGPNSAKTVFTVNSSVTSPITGPVSLCAGSTATYANTTSGGTWSTALPSIASISNIGIVFGESAGIDTIKYTVVNACGTFVLTKPVTIIALPDAGTISGPSVVCAGAIITLTPSVTGGSWSSIRPSIATVNTSGVVTGVAVGTDSIAYIVSNACGFDTSYKLITVNPAAASGTISGPRSLCPGNTITLTTTGTGGSWSSSSIVATVDTTGVVTGVAGGTAIISYSVVNSCGTNIDTQLITVNPLPNAGLVSGSSAVCVGNNATYTTTGSGGVWSVSNAAVASMNSSTGVLTGLSTGRTIVSYTATTVCGTISDTLMVTVSPAPATGTIGGATTICIGAPATLTTTGTGGVWSSSNSSIASVSTTGTVTGVASGTAIISYTVTTGCGSASDTQAITVRPVTSAGTILGAGTVCPSTTLALTSAVTGGTWTSSNATIATVNTTSGVVTGLTAGSATITYTVTDICGTATDTAIVTVSPTPSAGTILGPSTVCPGTTITLTNGVTGGTWSSNNNAIATVSSTGVVTGVATGIVTISYLVTNACGTSSTSTSITVTTGTGAGTISGPSTVCEGSNITLTDTVSGGSWSSSNPAIATVSTTGVVTGITSGSVAISYTATTSCGVVSAVAPVTVLARPVSGSVSGPATVCVGTNVTFSTTGTGGTWSSTSPSVASVSTTGSVTGIAAGNSFIKYSVSNTCGTAADSAAITVIASPGAGTITGTTTLCAGTTTTLADTATGGTWSSSNTTVATIDNSGVLTGLTGGTTTISYTRTTSCGPVSATTTVTVNPTADAGTISGSNSVCISSSITLTTTGTGGTWRATNTRATVLPSGVVGGLSSGLDTIQYIVTNSCGTDTASHVVNVGVPASAGNITGPTDVCVGNTIALSNATASGGTWLSSNNTVASVNTSGTVTGVSTGSAIISYVLTSSCGSSLDTMMVNVGPTPFAGVISGANTACTGSTLSLSESVTGGAWSSSNPSVATVSASGVVTPLSSGTTIISYTITTSCGAASDTQAVTVNAGPSAGTISGTTSLCPGTTTALTTPATGGTWSSSNPSVATVNTSGVVTGVTTGSATISYTVTSATCGSASATTPVTVNLTASAGTISGPSTVCVASNITLTDSVSGGTWSSSNSSIATVSNTGVVTGVTTGSVTISYVVATACGTATATKPVSVSLPANAGTVTGPTSLCTGGTGTYTTTGTGGTWSSSNPSVASINGSTGAVSAISSGNVIISYTSVTGCSTSTDTALLTVNTTASAGTITGTTNVCVGTSSTLTSTVPGGTWSSANTAIATISSTGSVTGVASGSTTISYTVTGTCGTAVATTSVTVTNTAVAGTITGPVTYCVGTPAGLSETVTGGTWSSSNTAVASVNASGVVIPLSSGTATITYTATTTCSSAFTTYGITVNPAPVAGTVSGPSNVCTGATISLSTTGTGGTWSVSNASVATIDALGNLTGVTAGTVTATYTVTNSCGSATATQSVTVGNAPNAGTVSGPSPLCPGNTGTFTTTGTGGVWSSSNTSVATVNTTGDVTAIAGGATTISYTVASSCSTAVATAPLSVTPAASAGALSGASTVCVSLSTTLTSSVSGGTWSSGNSAIATVDSAGVVTGVSTGATTITYTVTNSCGTATATQNITVNPLASAGTITGTTNVCIGATTALSNTTSGGVWSSSNPAIATVNSVGIVTGNAAGSTIISYSVTNSCGTVAATTTVNVIPFPSAGTIVGPRTACIGVPVTYVDTTSGGVWSSGNPLIATIDATGNVTGISAGTVNIYYTVTNGCGSTNVTIAINVTSAPSTSIITGRTTICPGTTTTLTDTTAGGTWSTSNASIATITGATSSTVDVTGLSTGTAIISYSIANACGTSVATAFVTVTSGTSGGTLTGPSTICTGATAVITPSVSGGSWSSNDTAIALVSASGVVTGVSAGTTVISYSVTGTCGVTVVTDSITISPATDAGSITGVTSACVGTTTTLGATVSGGSWSSSNTSVATINSAGVVTGIATGTTTITYTVSGTCGTAFTTATVTVNSIPSPGLITGVTTICQSTSDTFTETISGGTWSSSNPAVATVNPIGASSAVVTGTGGGTAIISYSVTSGCGTGIATAFVTVTPLPATGSITGRDTICRGTSTTFADSVTGGTWSSADTSIARVSSTGIVTGVATGTTTVSYSFTGSCGIAAATRSITVTAPTAAATISGLSAICLGSTITVTASVAGGTWSISDTSVASINATTGAITGRTAGSFSVSYTLSSGGGCVTTTTATDSVRGASAGTLSSATTTACVGSGFTLTPSVTGGVWASADTNIATVFGGVVTGRSAGTSIISYTATGAGGCTGTVTVNVTINPLPAVPVLTGSTSHCQGTAVTITPSVTGGRWSSSATAIASVDTIGTIYGVAPGVARISYTVTNSFGCTATSSIADTVFGASVVTVSGASRVCEGATATLTPSTTGGTWTSSNTSVATVDASGRVMGIAPGTATISYMVGAAGCSSDTSVSITVDAAPTVAAIGGATSVCAGSTTTLTDATAGGSWSVSDTVIASITSSGNITGRSAGTVVATYSVRNAAGCVAMDTALFVVNAIPTATMSPSGTLSVCRDTAVVVTLTPGSFASIQWMRNGSPIAGANASSYRVDTVGNYTALISNGSCNATISGFTLSTFSAPVITRGSGTVLYTGSYATYQWYLNGVLIPGATGSTYTFTSPGTYKVFVTNGAGCSAMSAGYVVAGGGGNAVPTVSAAQINLYPNPATSTIFIDAPFPVKAALFTVDGRKVYESQERTSIDVSDLANAMYMIIIYTTDDQFIRAEKFMKQ